MLLRTSLPLALLQRACKSLGFPGRDYGSGAPEILAMAVKWPAISVSLILLCVELLSLTSGGLAVAVTPSNWELCGEFFYCGFLVSLLQRVFIFPLCFFVVRSLFCCVLRLNCVFRVRI